MAISWGSWDGHLRVGSEVSRDDEDAIFKWYVGIDGYNYLDNQVLVYTGDTSDPDKAFYNNLSGGSHSVHQGSVTDYMLVDTMRVTGSPGETVSVRATLSGSYLGTSETPTKLTSITLADVPNAPATPTVSAITQDSAKITMTYPSNNGASLTKTRFRIFTVPTGGTSIGYLADPAATSHTFDDLNDGTDYWAEVAADNVVGMSAPSPRKKFTTTALVAPSKPVWATSTPTSVTQTSMTLTGTAPAANGSTISGYIFELSTDTGFSTIVKTISQASLTWNVSGLTGNKQYYARFRANSNAGLSAWSSTRNAKTSPVNPSAPTITAVLPVSSTSLEVKWKAGSDGGSPITGYTLQIDSDPTFGSPATYTTTSLGYLITGRSPGILYHLRVKQTTAVASSANSAVVTITLTDDGTIITNDDDVWVNGEFFFKHIDDWVKVS